jgi:CheY-like chemotaxis protein
MYMRVFLSSTYVDLVDYRAKASIALERLGQQGSRMEVFGARPGDATKVSLEELDNSQAFLGIYAYRYGYIPSGSQISITEQEFDFAASRGKDMFCFVVDDKQPWLPSHMDEEPARSRLEQFKRRIKEQLVVDPFTTPDDLAFKISTSLGRYMITAKVASALENAPKSATSTTLKGRTQVARRAARIASLLKGARLLLVNDVPGEMEYIVLLLRELGVTVTVAETSDEAFDRLKAQKFDVVISDMARDGIQDEGTRFLIKMHEKLGLRLPTIITLANFDPSRGTPPYAFGITNTTEEMLNLVFDALERRRG